MKHVLALDPPGSGQQTVHYIATTGDTAHALCSKKRQYPHEGAQVVKRNAVWQVRRLTGHDWICMNCIRSLVILNRPPVLKQKSKRGPDVNHKRVWLDRWFESQGVYHHGDPRAEK